VYLKVVHSLLLDFLGAFQRMFVRPRRTHRLLARSPPARPAASSGRTLERLRRSTQERIHDGDGHTGLGRRLPMTRHRHKTQAELEAQTAFFMSDMRASPVLLHFLVYHPFINRRIVSHPVPGRTHPSALPPTIDHGHVRAALPTHWHHRIVT
jgi:hypothetical protein